MLPHKKELAGFLFAIMLIGCNQNPYQPSDHFPSTSTLNISPLSVADSLMIGLPCDMIVTNGKIVIGDMQDDSVLWIVDLENGKVQRGGAKGEGPREFQDPVQIVPTDSGIVLHNRWHYTAIDCQIADTGLVLSGEQFKIPRNIDMLVSLDGNRFVASGIFIEARYAMFTKNDTAAHFFGDFPEFMENEAKIINTSKSMFHQVCFGINRIQKKYISCSGHVLEVFDYSDSQKVPQLLFQKLITAYDYWGSDNPDAVRVESTGKTQSGVKKIFAGENRIYLLYDPNRYRELKENEKPRPDILLVYDWEGKPVKRFDLDTQIREFCIDEKTNTLYCIIDNPDPALFKASI